MKKDNLMQNKKYKGSQIKKLNRSKIKKNYNKDIIKEKI